jgi:hypothetical protein
MKIELRVLLFTSRCKNFFEKNTKKMSLKIIESNSLEILSILIGKKRTFIRERANILALNERRRLIDQNFFGLF